MKSKQVVKTRTSNRSQSLSDVKNHTEEESHKQQTSGAYYTNNPGNLYGRVDPAQAQVNHSSSAMPTNTTNGGMAYNSGSNSALKFASNQVKNIKQQANHQRRSNSQMTAPMPVVAGTNFIE